MKKFIKKTIAGLIAGVMAVSSMPFTALTAQAADSTEKAYVKANIESFNGYTGTAKYTYNGTDLSQSDSAYYSNVLYDDGAFNDSTTQGDNSNMHGKLYINNNTVLMYDGTKDTILPVVVRAWPTYTFAGATIYFSGILIDDATTASSWEFKENWLGGKQTYNEWPTGTASYPSSNVSYGSGMSLDTDKSYIFKNKLYYKGATSTTNYYEKFNNSIKFKVKNYYSSFGTKGLDVDVVNSTSNVYVVNYKPIANAISTMKSVYNTIQATGEDKYCSDYLENFYKAAYKVMTLNPNNSNSYSYSSGVETAVKKLAGDIEDVVNNYLTTATTEPSKHTEVTVDGKEPTCTETGLTEGKKCSHCGVTLVAQTTIPVTSHTPGTPTEENRVEPTCTTAGSYKLVTRCTVCNTVITEETKTIPATGHDYTYEYVDKTHHIKKCTKGDVEEVKEEHTLGADGKCTVCKGTVIDYTAFDAAANDAGNIIFNGKSEYTDESYAEFGKIVTGATAKKGDVKTQAELDALTDIIVSAKTVLRKRSVTVTLVYVNDSHEEFKKPETVSYGETYNAVSDKNVEKWTVSTDNDATTTRLNTYDKTVSIVVTKDVVIRAFQTDEEQTEDSSKVTFYGKNNVVVAVRYVAKGTPLETNTVGVPEIPFYNKGKWDKETVTGTGSDISVKAVYETTQAEDKLCGVHYDGFEGGVKKYSYDSYVYLTGADTTKKYALYSDAEHTKLLTILNGIDFYAPKTSDIYVGEYTGEDKASIGITGSFNERNEKEDRKSAVYNCKFYLPEGATVVEYGLEVTLNGKTARVKAESKSERNEYSISLNAPISSKITAVDGRAYLTYTLDGKTTTIYSETVNQAL